VGGYEPGDTIVAPATPLAPSALGILRLSGPRAWEIVKQLLASPRSPISPRHSYVGQLKFNIEGIVITETAVLTFWAAPHSYTGEDVVEFSVHGSPVLLRHLILACTALGARLAEPGEFTYRAYLNGKLDLAQAEAVHDVITANSARALSLSEITLAGLHSAKAKAWVKELTNLLAKIEVIHDYAASDLDATLDPENLLTPSRLRIKLQQMTNELNQVVEASKRAAPLREGIAVAICGPPNVGKSTLFNALLGHERALTSSSPGTTRDYLAETLDSEGIKLTLVDTAGYHDAAEAVEAAGVRRAGDWARAADRVLWVSAADLPPTPIPKALTDIQPVQVITRCDLVGSWPTPPTGGYCVSGKTSQGIPELWQALKGFVEEIAEPAIEAFGARQAQQAEKAQSHLESAKHSLDSGMPFDALAEDIYAARRELQAIYEQENREAVIREIFRRFCVGK